jgi:hypothetical protein
MHRNPTVPPWDVAVIVAMLLLGVGPQSLAQQTRQSSAVPAAADRDVSSVDALVRSIYDVISGPAGKKRDYDRFRSLFAPEARLVQVSVAPDGSRSASLWTIDQFVAAQGAALDSLDFFERQVAQRTERFGDIAHVLSTFEVGKSPTDRRPFERGVNSVQLRYDGRRWWCVTILWTTERADLPIPARYLKGGGR